MSSAEKIPLILPAEPFRPEDPEMYTMSNGVLLYAFNRGDKEIIKLDVVMKAGTMYQAQPLVSVMTGKMLKEGTVSYNSGHISYQLDFHGAYIEFANGYDYTSISLICLNKHLAKLMPMFAEIIKAPSFPEKEFGVMLENRRQEFLINEEKVKTLASRACNQMIWGEGHPYAQYAQLDDFKKVDAAMLLQHYEQNYHSGNCALFAAGCVNEQALTIIDKYLCVGWQGHHSNDSIIKDAEPVKVKLRKIHKDGVQSAVRIGRKVMDKQDADFPAFQLLTTLLGGYFGSRLMKNIREDKGYTYGIGAYNNPQRLGTSFTIVCETANEFVEPLLSELKSELKKLQDELVSEQELVMVKNYLSGEFMRSFDGPFAITDIYRSLWEQGLDFGFTEDYLKKINESHLDKLQKLAQTWFDFNDFYIAIAGK